MRNASNSFAEMIKYSHTRVSVVDAYYNGDLTLAGVPFVEGTVSFDDSAIIKRSLSLTVPVSNRLIRLDPGDDPLHPLNTYGQVLHVRSGLLLPDDVPETKNLGWYLITKWARDDAEHTITITAEDLSTLVIDAQMYFVQVPEATATFVSEFTRMFEGLFPSVIIDAALVDRPLDLASVVWDRDRTAALDQICQAWPARWYINDDGLPVAAPPYEPVTAASTTVTTLSDGQAGTVLSRARSNERARVYNAVIVTGSVSDAGGRPPQAVLQIDDPDSPIRASGPFRRRPYFVTSPLVRSNLEADNAASALLDALTAFGRAEALGVVPDPRLELGDVVKVFTADGDAYTGRMTKATLPLTAAQGGMGVTVSTQPSVPSIGTRTLDMIGWRG